METDGKRYQIVTWAQERDPSGNVRNAYGTVLYDTDEDECELPREGRPEAFRLLLRANAMCRQCGPVAVGRISDGTFRPMALLAQPIDNRVAARPPAIPRRSLK